jgi:DNA-binding NtrC family response regulator
MTSKGSSLGAMGAGWYAETPGGGEHAQLWGNLAQPTSAPRRMLEPPPFLGDPGPMPRPSSPETETRTVDPPQPAGADVVSYLLVIDGASSHRRPLPPDGVLILGRAPDADVHIQTTAVSRRHARLILAAGEVQVADLGSHNGTSVNGERIVGSRTLSSGDVVTVGDTILVLRCEPRRRASAAIDIARVRQRLDEELERAADYARPLSLAVFPLGAGGGALSGASLTSTLEARALGALRRMDVLGWDGSAHLVAVLPELSGEAAREAVLGVLAAVAPLAPEVRGGIASYPGDGCDAETLLSGARGAAAMAGRGAVALAAETAVRHVIGDRAIVVADPAMIRLFELIRRLSSSDIPVLVLGETGAGKENAAAAVHWWSARAGRPLVTLNCAAIPETLVESELFGHEKGAFSDARTAKPGLLERASGGTVFLDEVGELPLGAQAKLLRALEAKRITRLGDVRDREVDFRVVAATNRDLEADVAAGRFRRDLLYRLGAAVVELPPLRHRPREISILARLFLAEAGARAGRAPLDLSESALARLGAYPFPGNVRELKNAMEYAAATAEGGVVEPWALPDRIVGRTSSPPPVANEGGGLPGLGAPLPAPATPRRFRPVAEELRELERTRMTEALEAAGGVQKRAAELIGMPIRTFGFKLKQYGLSTRDAKRPS